MHGHVALFILLLTVVRAQFQLSCGNVQQPCPVSSPEVTCFVDPCASLDCPEPTVCQANQCGGCYALCCAATEGEANPKIPFFGYGSIVAAPRPVMAGAVTEIDVTLQNDGTNAAAGVEVSLSYADWGISFSGWQEVGRQSVTVVQGGFSTLHFSHTFASQGHVCLEARITGVAQGGNTLASDDRGQSCMQEVLVGEHAVYDIPIANHGDKQIRVGAISASCPGQTDCPFELRFSVPGMDEEGAVVVEAGAETLARITANLSTSSARVHEILIQAMDLETEEANHVVVHLVRTRLQELLNAPLVCCIRRVRTRVTLEKVLVQALEALEQGMLRTAVKLLRRLIQKLALLRCEVREEEGRCGVLVEQLASEAASLLAQAQADLSELEEPSPARRALPHTSPEAQLWADALSMRRSGQGEAACLLYSKLTSSVDPRAVSEQPALSGGGGSTPLHWNTGSVANMGIFFRAVTAKGNVFATDWNVAKVVNMAHMFSRSVTAKGNVFAESTPGDQLAREQSGVTCMQAVTLTGRGGAFSDGSEATALYANNLNSCYFISASVPAGSRVTLRFTHLEIEQPYDYLQVFEYPGHGTAPGPVIADRVTGPAPTYSSETGFMIYFVTDESDVDKGWTAVWALASEPPPDAPPQEPIF